MGGKCPTCCIETLPSSAGRSTLGCWLDNDVQALNKAIMINEGRTLNFCKIGFIIDEENIVKLPFKVDTHSADNSDKIIT